MYSAVHNIDCLCSYWHSDPESDNSDSSDSDFEPEKEVIQNYIYICYSAFIHCTNSNFLIGWFVPGDIGLWRNNHLDVIIVV